MYGALRLRSDVFVVEQDCVYPDLDDKDACSIHLVAMATDAKPGDSAQATVRLVPPGISYEEPSIGRVVTIQSTRGTGLGRELMERSIRTCQRHWPCQNIRISAQQYLIRFYEDLGFKCVGKGYLEDGIPHIEMLRMGESIAQWKMHHALAVNRLGEALSKVPREHLNGSPENWGAAEVLRHLQLAEQGIWRYLEKKSNANVEDLPRTDLHSDAAGLRLIQALESNRKWKDPTNGVISPKEYELSAFDIWTEWKSGHEKAWQNAASIFEDKAWFTVQLFKHPLAGYLSLSDTLAFCSAHIHHHIKQLERLNP